jgi:hypothetical protein
MEHLIRVVKWRSRRWARHVECMGERRDACRVLVEKIKGNTSKTYTQMKG